ncbi:CaiB/BaiF CoA transferase family protein [Microbacterium sp. NPDC055357]
MSGQLAGLRVVEFLGLGPAPFGALVLADLGAEVLTITRPNQRAISMVRNRAMLELDLKTPEGLQRALEIVAAADLVIESFRPGVLDRLELTVERMRAENPRLIIARMTGWGQAGPLAMRAGHDINYIAVSGALDAATRAGSAPMPPANLLGDFAGGGMYLVIAVLAAIIERDRTGEGSELDIAILDGATYLTTMLHEYRARGEWSDIPGTNRLDTGAPYYDSYLSSDGYWITVGALEEKFFQELADVLEIDQADRFDRENPERWPALRTIIAAAIGRRTRDEWDRLGRERDICVAPVLALREVAANDQVSERGLMRPFGERGWLPSLPIGFVESAPSAAARLREWGVGGDASAPTGRSNVLA